MADIKYNEVRNGKMKCEYLNVWKDLSEFSENIRCVRTRGLQPICKEGMKLKIAEGKARAESKKSTAPALPTVSDIESRISNKLSNFIDEKSGELRTAKASQKRFNKGKMDIQIVNGKVQVTI